jgi:hypothetical protein
MGSGMRILGRLVSAERARQRGGRNSLASQPTASDFKGSTRTETFSVRSQVEHSKVRSSKPRSPGEMRPSAILCLQTGHMGRSLIVSPIIRTPGIIGKIELAVRYLSSIGRLFQAPFLPWNGWRGSRLIRRLR